jgi:hypothetical protein
LSFGFAPQETKVEETTRQFGTIVYDLPDGWINGRQRDGYIVLLPRFKDCKTGYVSMATSQPLKGRSLGDWLDTQTTRFIDPEDYDKIKVTSSKTRTGKLGPHRAAVMTIRVGKVVWLLTAIEHNNHAVLLGFESNKRDIKAWIANTKSSVDPFYKTLEIVDPGKSAILPKAKPGNLSGVYWGFTSSMSLGLDSMPSQRVKHHHYVLYNDGHFYYGTPTNGTSGLDRQALLKSAANSKFGVYEQRGNSLKLTFASGKVSEFARKGNRWKKGKLSIQPVTPLADGTILNGGISSFSATGNPIGSGASGGVAHASSITFNADGTYTGRSIGTTSATFSGGGGLTTSQNQSTGGTYEVKNGLIKMQPKKGEPRRSLIFKTGDHVMIGNKFFKEANTKRK